jgi:hypothetical protein
MVVCPACATETPDAASECPGCHLSASLFDHVREAAGPSDATDPVYLKTIADLIQSVDLKTPVPPAEKAVAPAMLSRPARFPPMQGVRAPAPPTPSSAPTPEPAVPAPAVPLPAVPALPPAATGEELRLRLEEYTSLAQRLGIDFGSFSTRLGAAGLTRDEVGMAAIAREMFVHLAGALAEEYDGELARRNELARSVSTPGVDAILEEVHRAIDKGDLPAAHRELVRVRAELGRIEEQWATGRVLVTECELLVETLRELGGDPTPALGPFEQGRAAMKASHREEAERLLARGAFALWAVLEPRFFEALKRLRDRLVEARSAGIEIDPALPHLTEIAENLRSRNFVGVVTAYRQLKAFVERREPPRQTGGTRAPPAGPERPSPSA